MKVGVATLNHFWQASWRQNCHLMADKCLAILINQECWYYNYFVMLHPCIKLKGGVQNYYPITALQVLHTFIA